MQYDLFNTEEKERQYTNITQNINKSINDLFHHFIDCSNDQRVQFMQTLKESESLGSQIDSLLGLYGIDDLLITYMNKMEENFVSSIVEKIKDIKNRASQNKECLKKELLEKGVNESIFNHLSSETRKLDRNSPDDEIPF